MNTRSANNKLEVIALNNVPSIKENDDIAKIIIDNSKEDNLEIQKNDIVVIAQKIISKSEGRLIDLQTVFASDQAKEIAKQASKDARLVELIIQESNEIIRIQNGVIIVEHNLGHILANAGIDQSNIENGDGHVLLLPKNPSKSADQIRRDLELSLGVKVGVIITDSMGRAWRLGTTGHAIGSSGVKTIIDLRGKSKDLFGRELKTTVIGFADQIASAAALVTGESNEGKPVAIVRGIDMPSDSDNVNDLIRPKKEDLFR
jgi:coenzyme F420-0:L-glutamate ligase/coenzyme F420-1:gamma-L-glutamate ligase|tara:strand:- start:936 stop:1715 length:780 start_codon:yes stop_codon:yes gene_type:complete